MGKELRHSTTSSIAIIKVVYRRVSLELQN